MSEDPTYPHKSLEHLFDPSTNILDHDVADIPYQQRPEHYSDHEVDLHPHQVGLDFLSSLPN